MVSASTPSIFSQRKASSEVIGSEATKAAKALERLAISETATMTRAERRTLTM
jgi:hypothetical protein